MEVALGTLAAVVPELHRADSPIPQRPGGAALVGNEDGKEERADPFVQVEVEIEKGDLVPQPLSKEAKIATPSRPDLPVIEHLQQPAGETGHSHVDILQVESRVTDRHAGHAGTCERTPGG